MNRKYLSAATASTAILPGKGKLCGFTVRPGSDDAEVILYDTEITASSMGTVDPIAGELADSSYSAETRKQFFIRAIPVETGLVVKVTGTTPKVYVYYV